MPAAVPFADDEELAEYLGIKLTPEGWAAIRSISPERREEYATMRAVEIELNQGRRPAGVIVCRRQFEGEDRR